MNISRALRALQNKFEYNKIESAQLEAEILLSKCLGRSREYFYSHPEEKLNFYQMIRLGWLAHRRLSGIPLAYVVGRKLFYGLDFFVNKNVLIPRPETELMVEEALKIIGNKELMVKNVIDVGTGSGCIIISLACNTKKNGHDVNYFGLDISKRALQTAKRNAELNNSLGCINFLHSDLLNVIDFKKIKEAILITANLPYLTSEQVNNSPSIQKEPKLALISGADGFDHYRKLFKQVKEAQECFNESIFVMCEIDEAQSAVARKTAEEFFPGAAINIKKDLNGDDRLLTVFLKRS